MAQLENRARPGCLVWPVLAITLSLAAPLSVGVSALTGWFWFGDEYLSMLIPPLVVGVTALICGLMGLRVARRQGTGTVLAIVALAISGVMLAQAVAGFALMMTGSGG